MSVDTRSDRDPVFYDHDHFATELKVKLLMSIIA